MITGNQAKIACRKMWQCVAVVVIMVFSSPGFAEDILITIDHNSELEAAVFNSFNRHNTGRQNYQSVLAAKRKMRALINEYRLQDLNRGWQIKSLGIYCGVYRLPADANVDALLQNLAADQRVDSVQLMHNYSVLTTSRERTPPRPSEAVEAVADPVAISYNDTYFERQYGRRVGAVENLHIQSTGKNVRVAVIDTGADTRHVDFHGKRLTTDNFVDNDRAGFRRDRHGTAVAGVITAVPNNSLGIVGLAPDADVNVIKACWHNERDGGGGAAHCNSLTIAAAMDAAIEFHSDVINLSLAGPPDPLVRRLVRLAASHGILIIAADPGTGPLRYPALLPEVLAVVNSVNAANIDEGVMYIAATDVLSTAPGGAFDFYSGASMSAALATAIAAHVVEQHPDTSYRQQVTYIYNIAMGLGLSN